MYRPLPDVLTIKSSPIEGLGVFSISDIYIGTILGVSHIGDYSFPDHLIRTPLGGFINHSEDPNCELERQGRKLFVKTIRKINAGEELTLQYGRTKTLFDPIL